MIFLSLPSPVGWVLCNKRSPFWPVVIHSLSTTPVFIVDNPEDFIHSSNDLSTISVDNYPVLWTKIFGNPYLGRLHNYITMWPVDKPVDKRGKICG